MSRAHDKSVEDAEPLAKEPEGQPPGRVVVDSRGRNVWQWAKDVLENTSVLLKRLENKDLSLEPTRKVPILSGRPEKGADTKVAKTSDTKPKAADSKAPARQPAAQPARKRDGGGFDPYNSR
jgi:hypothetical protein